MASNFSDAHLLLRLKKARHDPLPYNGYTCSNMSQEITARLSPTATNKNSGDVVVTSSREGEQDSYYDSETIGCPFPNNDQDLAPLPFRPMGDSRAMADDSSYDSEIMSTLNAFVSLPSDDYMESIMRQVSTTPLPFPSTEENNGSLDSLQSDDDFASMIKCNVFDINSFAAVDGAGTTDHHQTSASTVSFENYQSDHDSQEDTSSTVDKSSLLLELPGENQKYVADTKSNAERWEGRYRELEAFKSKYGHCNVPQTHEANPGLGRWLAQQRIGMRKTHWESKPVSKQDKKKYDRMSRLKQLGVSSFIGTGQIGKKCYNMDVWERQFASLVHYKELYGHCNVLTQAQGEFRSLGRWVSAQRKMCQDFSHQNSSKYKDGASRTEFLDRVQRLSSVGFQFVVGKGKHPRNLKVAK